MEGLSAAKAELLEHGWCLVPDVLSPAESADALARLWAAAEAYRARGGDTHIAVLDPNPANVRVFELLDLDPVFRDLIRRPEALALVSALLGPDFMISNFTANIARPGARSMSLHSDQALVVPEPWLEPWSINIIWCLTDVSFENGATLFIPGSQRVTRLAELGPDPKSRLRAFEARAGSIVAMDGRVWHTSGANITADQDRALLFGYYSRSFLRPQVNWNALLSAGVQRSLDPAFRRLLGLEAAANLAVGAHLLFADLGGHRSGD
ncbi:MAG TPA: phytanoyl-CoA dioxygenase family protein [Caulobacteraceae bacterium]|nr:phytanoyl-CoA dioxygenase family protein [Caulobacteraceae bacterium]